MRLSDASLAIRPRPPWEACDLGVLLARRHAGVLMASWAALTLPLYGLLTLVLWDQPSLAFLLFWWLKPLYERLPLFILSRALFGEVPGVRQSLRALPGELKAQLLPSLLWRRFSPVRSFALPVQQLEKLSGQARRERLALLLQRDGAPASWLTIVGMHLEMALWLGLLGLLYLMLPAQVELAWSWQDLLGLTSDWLWIEHLSNLLYVLVLIVWEPVYVACGFSLYLNRRTQLEAWDIELSFRRLRDRLAAALPILLASLCLLLPGPGGTGLLQAAESEPPFATESAAAPAFSRAQARERIGELLQQPPFQNRETVTRWRLESAAEDEHDGSGLLERLGRLHRLWQSLDGVALALEVLLWTGLLLSVGWLLWRYRAWLQAFGLRRRAQAPAAGRPPAQLFGLELAPESLPADPAAEAARLWDSDPRAALGLLYRGMLSELLRQRRVVLRASDTEGEVLRRLEQLREPDLQAFAGRLTTLWQNLAYGHRAPPTALREPLCSEWTRLFGRGVQA
ncbi:DUF4129 domain-containing protein [Stutzerimonas azotifigens]|uniref:DUF4129 domain-containing protein n=1 Tax=Stutzerimonas azotifigens TaxID=291995 RepID=UPI0003F7452D|nr:DUF4129 domain-containing protein [Stutzerimonas azotifigens]